MPLLILHIVICIDMQTVFRPIHIVICVDMQTVFRPIHIVICIDMQTVFRPIRIAICIDMQAVFRPILILHLVNFPSDPVCNLLSLQVFVNSKRYEVGWLKYNIPEVFHFPVEATAGIAAGGGILLVLILLILLVYRRQRCRSERIYRKLQIQLDNLESNVRNECKQGGLCFSWNCGNIRPVSKMSIIFCMIIGRTVVQARWAVFFMELW